MVTAQVEKPAEKVITVPFYAVIYYPGKESQRMNPDADITGQRSYKRPPVARYFTYNNFATAYESDGKQISPLQMQSIMVHPGTNVGHHVRLPDDTEIVNKITPEIYEAVFVQQHINQGLVNEGIIRIIPAQNNDGVQPGYRNFSEENALLLVRAHMHEKWIDWSLRGETRDSIVHAADVRKEEIMAIRRSLQENPN